MSGLSDVREWLQRHRPDREGGTGLSAQAWMDLDALIAAREVEAGQQALRDAAESLRWVRPEVCPCEHPEDCCGSVASCDAMSPTVKVVGADWLRDRADRMGGEQ